MSQDPDKTPTQPWGAQELLRDRSSLSDEDERPTLTECPRCRGNESLVTELPSKDGMYRSITESDPCFVCGGIGSATRKAKERWVAFARPLDMPADWLSRVFE